MVAIDKYIRLWKFIIRLIFAGEKLFSARLYCHAVKFVGIIDVFSPLWK